MLRSFDRIRAVFTPELLKAKRGLGDPSTVPIFIVGMPRSGTTLVEQILASHPQVFGAGEATISRAWRKACRRTTRRCASRDRAHVAGRGIA